MASLDINNTLTDEHAKLGNKPAETAQNSPK